MRKSLFTTLMSTLLLSVLPVSAQIKPTMISHIEGDPHCRQWVDSIFQTLSMEEKVGQLLVVTIHPTTDPASLAIMHESLETYHVGGILFDAATLEAYALSTNYAQENSRVPLLMTFDGEWGLRMRIRSIPAYPRNGFLGHTNDNYLLYRYGKETARQLRELGMHVNFAPVADVNINPNNPVIGTRSFGIDPHRVADQVIAYASGLENEGILSVSKHFPGHGDTNVDSHKALPVLPFTRERLDSIELYPFREYVRAGLGGVMVGHLEVPALDETPGLPSSLSHKMVTGLLKEEMGFDGLIFTDALAMKGVAKFEHPTLRAIMAGNDMVLIPRPLKPEVEAVYEAVRDGRIPMEYLDAECRKILTFKYALGLSDLKPVRLEGLAERINTPEAQAMLHELQQVAQDVNVQPEKDPTANP